MASALRWRVVERYSRGLPRGAASVELGSPLAYSILPLLYRKLSTMSAKVRPAGGTPRVQRSAAGSVTWLGTLVGIYPVR